MAALLASEESPEVIYLDEPPRGTLCTSLMAVDLIDDDEPLIIASCDQVVEADVNAIIESFASRDLDGGVVCVENDDSAWAYIRLDGDNVVEMAEESPVSNLAVAGFYYFKRGRDFVTAAERVVLKGSDHQGRFRISASINELILKGGRVGYYQLEPEDVQTFESLERSGR